MIAGIARDRRHRPKSEFNDAALLYLDNWNVRDLISLRFAARGPAALGRVFPLAYPALTASARKRASGRAG
jgi:hypothetical protein